MGCDPDEERPPPTAADIPDFPVYDIPPPSSNEEEASKAFKDLYHVLASIKKPQDITRERFRALNLCVETNVPVSQIVHRQGGGSLPPFPWEEKTQEENPPYKTSNAYPYPDGKRFDVLQNELLLDDDAAFREVTRMGPRQGNPRVRITQTRKFWTALERMAQYWDTRLDVYFEQGQGQGQGQEQGQEHEPKHEAEQAQTQQTQPEVRYKGRRVGAGHEMPEEIREDVVRGFLEMIAWAFGCQVMVPSLPPRLTVRNTLLFPVRVSLQAAQSRQDRMLARSGLLEGPVMVAQCRPETAFRTELEPAGSGIGEVCDLYREVGGMLLAAQERAREGATEVLPGEGKWWTTVPRWGGGQHPGDDDSQPHGNDGGNGDREHGHESNKRKYDSYPAPAPPPPPPSRRGRKVSNADKWKMVQPGPSLWDRRMRYQRIGTDETMFDDVCNSYSILPASYEGDKRLTEPGVYANLDQPPYCHPASAGPPQIPRHGDHGRQPDPTTPKPQPGRTVVCPETATNSMVRSAGRPRSRRGTPGVVAGLPLHDEGIGLFQTLTPPP